MIAFKFQKRQRDQQRKQKVTENRKHLANVRVVQKNLVFVVGLPPRLANAEILRKHEYFGKYGKIHKVVINPSTTYAGIQGPSASAYVTYVLNTDALRAIQSVNNIMIDGRLIKTSLGTTKYCSHFMKNQQCPKGDCMYLHELGDPEASFTKEEMHQGKHQDFEKRLHELLNANTLLNGSSTSSDVSSNNIAKSIESKVSGVSISSVTTSTTPTSVNNHQKDAWPTLSLSPVCQKDPAPSMANKKIKERYKQEKTKNDKHSKSKNKSIVSQNNVVSTSVFKDMDTNLEIDRSLFSDFSLESLRVDNVTSNLTTKKKEGLNLTPKNANNGTSELYSSEENTTILPAFDRVELDDIKPISSKKGPLSSITDNEYKNSGANGQKPLQLEDNVEISTAPKTVLNVHEGCTKSKENLKILFKVNQAAAMDINSLHNSGYSTDTNAYLDYPVVNSNVADTIEKNSLHEPTDLSTNTIDASIQNQLNGRIVPNLPDLINDIPQFFRL